jgi:hypothetical protein
MQVRVINDTQLHEVDKGSSAMQCIADIVQEPVEFIAYTEDVVDVFMVNVTWSDIICVTY